MPVLQPTDVIRFGIVRGPADRKPLAFTTIAALARHIHRDRQGRSIELVEQPLGLPGCEDTKLMVGVHVLGLDGGRERFMGYAWTGPAPHPRERLKAALDTAQAPVYGRSEAA